jgi:protein-disulfide isomerase
MKKKSLKKMLSKLTRSVKFKHPYLLKIRPFKNLSLNAFLVIVIVVFAFFLGMLTNKVFDLEQQLKDTSTTTATAATAPNTALVAPSTQPSPATPVNVGVGNYPPRGSANAKVTLIEFADLRCPFCEQWFQTIEPNLMKDYVNTGKVKFYFRNYAFLGPASTLAAEAGECANDQGKFWTFHDYMYQHQPDESDTSMYTDANLTKIAGSLGMDESQFSSCLSSKKVSDQVAKDLSDGQAAGVSGTPTTFINGVPIVGAVPYSQIKTAIDAALK